MNHITPNALLLSLNPFYDTLLPITPETRLLIDVSTGLYAQNLCLQLVLPRARPDDVGLWKIWQGSLLVVDSILLAAVGRNLWMLGTLAQPAVWEGGQWMNLLILVWCVGLRAAFVQGWGFVKQGKRSGKKE